MFLFYCFHIFGFGFQILFFGLVILFFGFGFWLSVRNGFLYFVFGFSFFIFYFNFILANRLASPFLFGPLFFILVSPVYSVNKDQLYFYLSSIRSCYCSCFKSSSLSRRLRSSSVDCSYLQNVLEL